MPVTLAVPDSHTPMDCSVRLCSAKVRYIDGDKRRPSAKLARPAAPGACNHTATSWSGWGYGRGFSRMLSSTVKTAALAPMPIASVRRTVTANPGDLRRRRNASFRSPKKDSRRVHCQTSRLRVSMRVGFPKARRAAWRASTRERFSRRMSCSVFSSMCSRTSSPRSS
jgi:hypothetical protein